MMDGIVSIADSRRKLGEVDAEIEKARNVLSQALMEQLGPEDQEEASRHLGVHMSRSLTRTNWCPNHTNRLNTPCPDYDIPIFLYDTNADRACRRFQHAIKFDMRSTNTKWRYSCDVERDLNW
jgi:hypothetical protein